MRLQVRSLVSLLPALSFILVVFSEHVSAELFVFPSGTLTLEQCSQVDLSWHPEQPPFQLWVAPDREIAPGDPTLRTLGPINDPQFHWTVDLPVGQNFSFTYIRLQDPYTLYASGNEWTVVAGDNTTCIPEGTPASLTNARPPPSATPSNFNAVFSPSSSTHVTTSIAALGGALGGGAIVAVGTMLYRRRSKGRGQMAVPVPPPETEEARDTSDLPSPSVAGRIRSVTTRDRALYTLSEHPNEENTLAAHAHETQTEVTSPGTSGSHPANTQMAAIPNEGRSDPAHEHEIGTTPPHSRRPGSDEGAQATISVTHGIIEEGR